MERRFSVTYGFTEAAEVARGNDGNLLQHTVEAELATRLLAASDATGLHLVCTHSMAPFEPLQRSFHEGREQRTRFKYWWDRALDADASAGEPTVLRAYRITRQIERDRYPNSAEIASAFFGIAELAGTLVEHKEAKYQALAGRWEHTKVRVIQGSWRAAVGQLHAPADLDRPWLFTMDPFTYRADNDSDDGDLHPHDFAILQNPVRSWLASGQPGVFCVFCYAMSPDVCIGFRKAVESCRNDLDVAGLSIAFAEAHIGPKAHVGAMISLDRKLLDDVCERWEAVRDHAM